jgi:hypothetical protein
MLVDVSEIEQFMTVALLEWFDNHSNTIENVDGIATFLADKVSAGYYITYRPISKPARKPGKQPTYSEE